MTTQSNNNEQYNDPLEYVNNIKELGGNEQMAKYQARYISTYVEKSVRETIADLHLERFATKEDIIRLEKDMEKFATKDDLHKLEKDLMQHIHRLDNKISRHTIYTITTIVLFNLPAPAKHVLAQMLHI